MAAFTLSSAILCVLAGVAILPAPAEAAAIGRPLPCQVREGFTGTIGGGAQTPTKFAVIRNNGATDIPADTVYSYIIAGAQFSYQPGRVLIPGSHILAPAPLDARGRCSASIPMAGPQITAPVSVQR